MGTFSIQRDGNDEVLTRTMLPYPGIARQFEMSQLFQCQGETVPAGKQRASWNARGSGYRKKAAQGGFLR